MIDSSSARTDLTSCSWVGELIYLTFAGGPARSETVTTLIAQMSVLLKASGQGREVPALSATSARALCSNLR
jgi:hypothetical protein